LATLKRKLDIKLLETTEFAGWSKET